MAITAKDRYGCSGYRASRTCSNRRTILRKEVEDRLFIGFRTNLLNTTYLDAFTAEFQEEVNRQRSATTSGLTSKGKNLDEVTRQIDRIVDHIVNGAGSKRITSKLTELEAEKESLKVEIGQCETQATVIPTNNIVRSIGQRSGNSLMGWRTLRSV